MLKSATTKAKFEFGKTSINKLHLFKEGNKDEAPRCLPHG